MSEPYRVSRIDRVALPLARIAARHPKLSGLVYGRTRWGNPFPGDGGQDPYRMHAAMRADGPVAWNPWFQQWFVTGYDEAKQVLSSPDVMVGGQTALVLACKPHNSMHPQVRELMTKFLLFVDPPDHSRLRRLVSSAFTPKQISQLEEATRAEAKRLLAEIDDDDDQPDIFAAYNAPLPIYVIAELLGLPAEDRAFTEQLSDALTDFLNPIPAFDPAAVEATMLDGIAYFTSIIESRRANPTADLLSAMLTAEDADDRLDRFEIVALAMFLMFAGHETTSGLLGTAMLALSQHPDQCRLLRENPALWPNAVEEFLRYDTSLQLDPRTAARDFSIGDAAIKKGQNIIVLLGAANRDPRRWQDPDRLQLDRADPRGVAFGHGIHHCLGASLARMEIRIGLECFLDAFPDFAIEPDDLTWKQHMALRGPIELPLERRR